MKKNEKNVFFKAKFLAHIDVKRVFSKNIAKHSM